MHLRDAHGCGDLLLGLVVEEAQDEDAALALRELPHRLDEFHAIGGGFDSRIRVAQHVRERGQEPLRSLHRSVEGPGPYSALGTDGLRRRGFGQVARPGDFQQRGRAPSVGLLEFLLRPSHLSPGLLHGSRQPYECRPVPQVPLQLSGNRRHRIGQKGVAMIRVVAVDSLDQA